MQNKILVILSLAVVALLTFFSVRSYDKYKAQRTVAAQETTRLQEQKLTATAKYQQSLNDTIARLQAECVIGKAKVPTLKCE